MRVRVKIYGLLLLLVSLATMPVCAQGVHKYSCELGVQAGCGYYIGEGAKYIFTPSTIREVFGAQFRYKIDDRWAMQVKGQFQHTSSKVGNLYMEVPLSDDDVWHNKMINLDVCAEFNFFRFGPKCLDTRVKQLTPYMLLGLGCSLYNGERLDGSARSIYGVQGGDYGKYAVYIPTGLGLKWKFSEHCGLNLSWQHNWYMFGKGVSKEQPGADNLEGVELMDGHQQPNGSNVLYNDRTGQLVLGIVFEFVLQRHVCVACKYYQ